MTLLLLLVTSSTAWAQHSPTLSVETCEGKRGSLYVKGWCEDPDDISIPLTVEVHILDADHNHVQGSPIYLTANKERFGEDNQWHNNGFESYIPITTAATYRVSVYANDATGDANTTWNDYLVQVAVSAPYTVTYNANGGSGAPAAQKKHHGIDLTLSSNVPVNGDYGLVCWNTASNGGGISYQPGDTYTTDADVTLYAIWTATGFPGSGSEAAPYIISSTEQWNLFASNVNNGNTYNGKWFKLGADITVSTMAGTYDTPFQGTFDGDGHTMNLAINATGIVGTGHPYLAVAPFRYVNGATFKNLHTTGTVTRTDYSGESNMAFGGLIGAVWQYRSATIIGCRSSVNVNYSFDWENNTWVTGHLGGFIGWNDGNVTFTDCLFDGTLAGRPYHAGGFVGWHRWGSMTLNNCLMNGTGSGLYGNGGFRYTFCGLENSVSPTFNNCYYKTSIGGGQGTSTNNSGETLRAQLGHGWIVSGSAVVPCRALVLFSTANNTSAIATANSHTYDKVVLDGRTFYRDGSWNTICLPFNLNNFSGTPLEGATVKTLASSAYSNGTMTLTFTQVNSIQAGKPYIVKWSSGSNLVTPVFNNITVSKTTSNINTTYANFIGGYAPFQNLTYLYDAHNTGGNAMHGALNISDPAPVTGQSVYWYTNSGHTQLATTIPFDTDGNVTLYGVWSGDFNITYDLAGGTVATPNPTTYTAQTSTFTLVNPTRDGYVFTGWTGSNGNTPQTNVTITKGSTGDRHYTANWRVRVDYQSYNTSANKFETLAVPEGFQYLDGSTSTNMSSNGWYVVNNTVRVQNRIQIGVNTTVRIVLCDGVKLYLTLGITLQPSSTLIIYGQSAGTGELYCNLNGISNVIGTPQDQSGGTVIIHGGKVTAITNNGGSAAIGGFGNYGGGATVTIYGGNVTAKGTGGSGSGIGGSGWYGKGGTVNIQGGTVEVQAGTDGMSYAIGGYTDHGKLTLGNVRVYASSNASTPVNQGDRVSTCRSTYAKIVKCTQHNVSGGKCQYCNATICQVTYNSNGATGGSVPSGTIHAKNDYVTVQGNTGNLVRTGYTFSGWNTKADGTGTNYAEGASFKITGNVTLYAKWIPITYTVRFNKNNSGATGTMADQTMTYDAAQALSSNTFNRSGYDFMGWSTTANGSVVYTNGQSVSNLASEKDAVVNLYAIWQLNTYSITYNLNEGSVATPNPTSYTVLSDAITLVNPTREGYTFTGWTGTGLNGPTMTVTIPHGSVGDRSYKATWTLTYTISYDLAGGSTSSPQANPTTYTEVSSDITLVNPTRDGYTFAGWTGTDLDEPTISVTIANGSTGNRSYTATWVPNYAITYDLAGGTASNLTYYCVLSDAITLNNPIRTGYTFAGWIGTDLDGPTMTVTIPHGSEGDRSYTATWTITTYTITYDLAGGSVETDNPITYTYIDKDITLVNPTREGYYFVGWTGTDLSEPTQNVTIPAGSLGNRSYTAVWTIIYTITYEGLEEGTFPSEPPTTYTVLSETFTLVNPVRDLYDFAGWTGTGLTQPTMTVTIPKGSTGNRTYHATWSLKEGIYISYNTETGEYETHGSPHPPTHLESTSATTIGTTGQVTWYMVKNAGVIASERLTVRGMVNLILADGASLTANKGITVHSGNTLNIYGQAGGTGSLNATVYSDNYAAIGTENNWNGVKNLGTITIHGGNITATNNTDWSAGIGGGVGCGGGSIAIYGGTVHASASSIPDYGEQQAIGSGSSGVSVTKILADGLCVYAGNNTTPVNYNNRIGNLANKVVRVEPCTKHNWNGGQCTYCNAYRYHQITYNGNGYTGDGVPAVATFNVTTGITTAIGTIAEAGTMERTGYTFTGWNTEADGSGSAYAPGETVSLRQSITLYAQWNPITYTITYDLAGGYEPTIPNPTTYTIESGDITLNNPTRVDIDEQNGTTTNYLFMGWTGTGLDAATQTVTISHGSTGNRTYTATWDVSDIPFEGIDIDHDCGENEVGRYFVKMPYPGYVDYVYNEELDDYEEVIVGAEETPRIVNIPGWFTSSFKVYDDGGKDESAQANPSESHLTTLILNAPEGKVFSVQGVLDICPSWYDDTDWLKIYDGAGTDNEINYVVNESYEIDPFVTSANSIRFDLHIENGHYPSNMDLTVSVTDPPFVLSLVENSLTPYGATVEWTGPSDSYNLQIAEGTPDGGESPLVWTTVDNASNPYTFDNLDFETTYSVRVIGVTDGQPDRTSNILSFTTLERCPVPTNLEIVENSLSAYGATVSWRGFSDNYNIKLGEVNYLVNADFETGNLSQAAFTTTSSYPWTVVENSHSGSWCAKSASGNDNEISALEIQVTLTADEFLTFSAKVSSESGWDKAYFSIDENIMIDGISGDGEWNDYSYPLAAGTHTLRWYYTKDDSYSDNNDCFYVDDIRITNGSTEVGNYTSNTNSYALTGLSAGTTYRVQVQADGGNDGTSQWSSPIMFTTSFDLILANAADNSDAIRMAAANGGVFKVTLAGRTLWKDGDWNTLCLPFSLGNPQAEEGHHFDGTQLEGATVMTLASTGFEDGTLTMTFADATSIEAGKPYIVKWTTGDNLVNPVFSNVLISAATANVETQYADFIGTYAYMDFTAEDKSILFLGAENTLHYPQSGASIGAFRAYFQLKNGLTAGDPEADVRAFNLNFGSEDTGIVSLSKESGNKGNNPEFLNSLDYYTLDGVRLDGKPTKKGLYIVNGKKVVVP